MQATRRSFLKLATAAASASTMPAAVAFAEQARGNNTLEFRSPYIYAAMNPYTLGFARFAIDSLGKGKLEKFLVQDSNLSCYPMHGVVRAVADGFAYTYEPGDPPAKIPWWSFQFQERSFTIRCEYSKELWPNPLALEFSIDSHATLLGLIDEEGMIKLPAVLHFPAAGSLRVTSNIPHTALHYDAAHSPDGSFIRIMLPQSSSQRQVVEYTFEVVSIYPDADAEDIAKDPRYDGYRRDYLSMFQLNPRRRALANNVASDCCAFTVFEYSAMAAKLPPLAPGLTAMDMIRQTLERYIGGMPGYGMVGYKNNPLTKWDFLDVYPSLLMASGDYMKSTQDKAWVERNYSVLRTWAEKMIAQDADDDGLLEYPASGNSGSWSERMTVRPANWWDTIGFGHKDAYSNALAYRAFRDIAGLASISGNEEDSRRYRERAQRIKDGFYNTFYNPETGVLAGWKSADGKLHDYYFLFVSGMAVVYNLVTPEQGRAIWTKMLAKMKDVGYTHFENGLPGNLIPVRREDYVDHSLRYGGPTKADGSDGFQIYENGGATACYAYYTIEALRRVGYTHEADTILFAMLKSFEDGNFQGRDPRTGMTYDWMTWDGQAHGYEGLLVDGYLTLLAAVPSQRRTT